MRRYFTDSAASVFGHAQDKLGNFFSIVRNEIGSIGPDISAAIKEVKYPHIWSEGKYRDAVKNAFGHFKKHGHEFPQHPNALKYVEGAHDFMKAPPSGTLVKVRENGEKVFYHPGTETLAVQSLEGAPKTMFKPDPSKHGYPTNLDYFNAQQRITYL